MANRSYLYSTSFVPGRESSTGQRRVVGVSEWNYDIPIVFKLLLSGNPRLCKSLIFDTPDEIAVAGDYQMGVERMLRFLETVPHPEIGPLKEEAEQFLSAEHNSNSYFLLECGEIFSMGADSSSDECKRLLEELTNLGPLTQKAIAELEARIHEESHPPGFVARLFGARPPVRKNNSTDMVYELGLGNWTNVLFFDPS